MGRQGASIPKKIVRKENPNKNVSPWETHRVETPESEVILGLGKKAFDEISLA